MHDLLRAQQIFSCASTRAAEQYEGVIMCQESSRCGMKKFEFESVVVESRAVCEGDSSTELNLT